MILKSGTASQTPDELEDKIKKGAVEEHPAWETIIQVENLLKQGQKIQKEIGGIPN